VFTTRRSIRMGVAILVVAGLVTAAGSLAVARSPWSFLQAGKTAPTASPAELRSNLHYPLATRWDKVLHRLAADHGLTMVMDRVPRDRFRRWDRTEHTLPAAMGVINEALAEQDFRLIRQDDFLVLLHLKSTRTRYRRTRLPGDASWKPREQRTVIPTGRPGTRSETHTIRPRGRQAMESTPRVVAVPPQASPIRQVAASEPTVTRLTSTQVTPRHRTAVQLARRLYSAFLAHSELIDEGPGGLPAFRVMDRPTKGSDGKPLPREESGAARISRFSVGIDSKNNRLLIEAPQATAGAIVRMISVLDVPGTDEQPRIEVRDSQVNASEIAKQVRPVLKQLSERKELSVGIGANGKQPLLASVENQNANTDDGQPGDAAQDTKPRAVVSSVRQADDQKADDQKADDQKADDQKADDPSKPFTPTEAILGGLKGEVKIEVLPDGRLVVIGNQGDVDKVMTLIQLLEAYGAPTVPDLDIVFLKHVNSEALASLLTSVYETLNTARTQAGQRSQTVTVVPVVKPNAVLILAPGGDIESILELADELDRPVDPATEFDVFRLKSASASQVATMLEDLYEEREERPGLATRVVVYPDIRTNSIIVQARPRDLNEVAELVKRMDRDSADSVNQLRVVQLKHAIAEELSETINLAIQSVINPARQPTGSGVGGFGGGGAGGAQTSQQLRDVRSAVLELIPDAGSKDPRVVSGILSDIRINPDARTNSLVVTAPEKSMKMMIRLIERLDKPTSVVADIKHFLLENADATSVTELLAELFVTDDTGQGGQLGVQLAGAEDASSSIVPLRFSVDVRTNSIFAVGGREALDVVEAVVARLDQSDIRQRKTEVYRMIQRPATEIANAINTFLQSQRDLQQIDPDLVSPFEQIEREVIVVSEPETNSLILSATPRYYDEIMKMISALDKAPEQVTVQALIVEVELSNIDEFGVELGFQDSVLFDRGTVASIETISQTTQMGGNDQTITENIISSEGVPGFNFNQPFLGNNTLGTFSKPAQVGKQALSNFQMGRVNGELGFGGLVLSAGSESVNILLRALSENRRVEVLSRPMVQAMHNQTGIIHVGQTFQQINGVGQANALTGVAQPLVEEKEVGIQLTVTPRVSPDGSIVMDVTATKNRISPVGGVPIFTDPATGNTVTSPVIDTATAQASVGVRDGQTIVLGGMITRTEENAERKVPWLADLPLLGTAFRYDAHSISRKELLIFLTPRIMRTPDDYEEQKQIEAERMNFMLENVEELHGPLFSAPKSVKDGQKTETPGEQPAAKKPGAKKPGAKKPGADNNGADAAAELGELLQQPVTTVDDGDAEIFSLPEVGEGMEPGVSVAPAVESPITSFFKSLIP